MGVVMDGDFPPWVDPSRPPYKSCESARERLQVEISDFCKFLAPTLDDFKLRSVVVARFTSIIRHMWREANVYWHGSSATGLFLPWSDIDVVICGVPGGTERLQHLKDALVFYGLAEDEPRVFDTAKVPLIKAVDCMTGAALDITFDVHSGPQTVHFVNSIVKEDKALFEQLHPLVLIIKTFLRGNQLNDTYTGGLSSHNIFLLSLYLIQMKRSAARAARLAAAAAAGSADGDGGGAAPAPAPNGRTKGVVVVAGHNGSGGASSGGGGGGTPPGRLAGTVFPALMSASAASMNSLRTDDVSDGGGGGGGSDNAAPGNAGGSGGAGLALADGAGGVGVDLTTGSAGNGGGGNGGSWDNGSAGSNASANRNGGAGGASSVLGSPTAARGSSRAGTPTRGDAGGGEGTSADMLIDFLRFYGRDFIPSRHGLSVRDGGRLFDKTTMSSYRDTSPGALCVEDPITGLDIGGACFKFASIRDLLATTHDRLVAAMRDPSLLTPLTPTLLSIVVPARMIMKLRQNAPIPYRHFTQKKRALERIGQLEAELHNMRTSKMFYEQLIGNLQQQLADAATALKLERDRSAQRGDEWPPMSASTQNLTNHRDGPGYRKRGGFGSKWNTDRESAQQQQRQQQQQHGSLNSAASVAPSRSPSHARTHTGPPPGAAPAPHQAPPPSSSTRTTQTDSVCSGDDDGSGSVCSAGRYGPGPGPPPGPPPAVVFRTPAPVLSGGTARRTARTTPGAGGVPGTAVGPATAAAAGATAAVTFVAAATTTTTTTAPVATPHTPTPIATPHTPTPIATPHTPTATTATHSTPSATTEPATAEVSTTALTTTATAATTTTTTTTATAATTATTAAAAADRTRTHAPAPAASARVGAHAAVPPGSGLLGARGEPRQNPHADASGGRRTPSLLPSAHGGVSVVFGDRNLSASMPGLSSSLPWRAGQQQRAAGGDPLQRSFSGGKGGRKGTPSDSGGGGGADAALVSGAPERRHSRPDDASAVNGPSVAEREHTHLVEAAVVPTKKSKQQRRNNHTTRR